MVSTLIYSMHPNPEKSVRGRSIINELIKNSSITIRELGQIYSSENFKMTKEDIEKEQEIILKHDRLVFLYPMYWYSMPAFGRSFLESIFTVGFAFVYAAKANAKLDGKLFKCIVTLGATTKYFTPEHLGTPEQIQHQMSAICAYTGMKRH